MIVGNGGIATEMVHELESVDIVWSVKDDAIAANFIDAGCAEFFSSSINRTTPEEGSANPEISIAIQHRISGKLRHAKRINNSGLSIKSIFRNCFHYVIHI